RVAAATAAASAVRCPASPAEAPLPLGLVAAGLCRAGPGPARGGAAGPAHGPLHPALGLGRGARVGTPAPVAARAAALRAGDRRLAAGWCRGAALEMAGDRRHGRLGLAAAGRGLAD